ncbi:zinc finger MYM-type protein 1-like [Gossypium hirsutum]|uniref:Zinc finger MYM-type protein 1-like n=1 Tax=Gossypium hirsutum TaxID=3635 RepID=A0A1U8PJV9_GOSHI|nr:zinc finger MYM-type protein 1-like [Gossypium hirsutum]
MKDTASLTLKNVIFNVLLQHSFDIQNIRGQGYDGPTNMLGEFNRLQTLILNDCRYAYYVNCFAHYLQLALVVAAREVVEVHQFFKDLFDIVNVASASSKQHDELQKAQFYLEDFSQQEEERILYELKHYELDVCKHPDLRKISTLSELCRSLVESGKSVMYPLIDRLIRLILTLPVSTAFAERVFSAMKIVKTRLHSKMEDDFLRSSFIVYIEKEFVEKFDVNKTIDDFSEVKDRRVQLK